MSNSPYTSRIYDNLPEDRRDIAWALSTLAERRALYERYQRYYTGDQVVSIEAPEYSEEFRAFLKGQIANVCPAVVAALTDRLGIQSIEGDEAAAARAWELWEAWHLAGTANRIHTEMFKMGDAYVIVWPDADGVPRLYPQTALEVCHAHDHERPEVLTKAAKLWQDGRRWHLNLYYPGRIERYRTGNMTSRPADHGSFEAFADDDGDSVVRNDYGVVPIFHFPYQSDMHDHGTSVLRDILSLQDSINENRINRAVVLRFGAFPLRILLGVDADTGDDGIARAPIRAGIDRLISIANPDGGIAEFKAASIEPYTTAIREDLNMITVITGIPPHHFQALSGDFPSGESLKTSESRLVNRTYDAQIDLSANWGRVLSFMLLIDDQATGDVRVVWKNPVTRSENDEVNRAATLVRDVQVPPTKAWERIGFEPDEIVEMEAAREVEQAAAAERGARLFDAA